MDLKKLEKWLERSKRPIGFAEFMRVIEPLTEYSKEHFQRASTWKEFTEVWRKFFCNQMLIPSYGGFFWSKASQSDNPVVTEADMELLYRLNSHGIITKDSQFGGQDKTWNYGGHAYVYFLAPRQVMEIIAEQLTVDPHGLVFVYYNPDNPVNQNVLVCSSISFLGSHIMKEDNDNALQEVSEWSPQMKPLFQALDVRYGVIVDLNFHRDRFLFRHLLKLIS